MAGALPIFNRINYRRGCFMKKSFQRVIATLNLFQGKQPLTIFMFAAFFALSACDDSSSASDDNNEISAVESSSSVKDSDSTEESSSSIDKKSSGNESTEKDKSSSSENKSNSSAKETKVSSDSKSSSSIKSGDSSSSKKDVSSSSSSEKQSSSSVKSSSSSVKRSSSSVASSSSFVKQDYTSPNLSYGVFEYEQRKYKYLTVTGKDTNNKAATINVMAENLNVGIMVDGSENQSDNSKVERYCYNNDTTKCLNYGGLYQWAEMMNLPFECNSKSCADSIKPNHQGICPDGWRLLTYNDFYIVVHADGNDAGVKGVRSTPFGGLNYTGYSLIGAGMRLDDDGVSSFIDINEAEEQLKVLNAKVRLHLSGTPYRILMGSEFSKEDIVAFCQFSDIVKAQKAIDSEGTVEAVSYDKIAALTEADVKNIMEGE